MKTPRFFLLFSLAVALFVTLIPVESSAQGNWVYFGRAANARVKVVNHSRDRVRVYAIDRWGRWSWAANLDSHSEVVLSSPPGEEWVVTDFRNHVLDRVRANAGVTTLEVGASHGGGIHPVLNTGIKFKNYSPVFVLIFRVNNWRGWEWSAEIPPGGEWRTASDVGRPWMVTNRKGVLIRKAVAEEEPRTIDIGK